MFGSHRRRRLAKAAQACPNAPRRRYFLFISDPKFDPGYKYEFFAFEPMSHGANAHNLSDGGGLRRLAPGESLMGGIRLTAELESWKR